MPKTQTGAISFGLVYVPVELHLATQDNDVHFNQLAKEFNERVQYKKTCRSCKKDLNSSDIVRGFQYEKDKYVVITDDEIESIKTEKDRNIAIEKFVAPGSVKPVYYNKTYQLIAHKGGEKPFELLRVAMLDSGKYAIGRTVIGEKEHMVVLVPDEQGILLTTMHWHDEVRDVAKVTPGINVNEAELKIAQQLIDAMAGEFEPAAYKNQFQEKLRELISAKIHGKQVVAARPKDAPNVIDLMEALKASVEQKAQENKKRSPRRRQGA